MRMDVATAGRAHAIQELRDEFDARFESLRARLNAVCTAIAGPDDAPDLVQETYLRASERLHQLRDPHLFDAWVVRIALNEAKGLRRRARRQRERLAELVTPEAAATDAGLRQLVDELPARERAVVVLQYGYGYRMGEIAGLLGLSEINVRTIAFRARRHLRAQLEDPAP